MTSRRTFIQIIPLAGTLALLAQAAHADGAKVDEKDPQAAALGYVADASKADKAKYKNFVAGSHCGNCALYQGKAEPQGACPLFQGKLVANAGWCSAWAKKS